MKNHFVILRVLLAVLLLSILFYCKKEALKVAPTVTSLEATNITSNSAIAGGAVTADGGSPVTARGVCWSTNQNPSVTDGKTSDGTGTGSFTSSISGLTPGATYYARAYATNSVGSGYGNQITIKTTTTPPVVTTTTISTSSITSTSANGGGNVTSDGGATVTARGVCWGTTTGPTTANSKTTDATGTGIFTSSITGLTPGSTYYVRAYATNSAGTVYGTEVTFSALPNPPTITTNAISNITATTATSGGNITSDGGAAITARGVCWGTSQNPTTSDNKTTDGTGSSSFSSSITGLTSGITYYVRAYATNSAGSSYGIQISFSTTASAFGTVTDRDGNVYDYVTIGSQVWMASNLQTTTWDNGYSIGLITYGSGMCYDCAWNNMSKPAYCWYNNGTESSKYGVLYNWFTVEYWTLCPTGWHVPNDSEWTTLATYLGGQSVAGGKLKETGYSHWKSPNTGATDAYGFKALPGGGRDGWNSVFGNIGYYGDWWSFTRTSTSASSWSMSNTNSTLTKGPYDKRNGCSVRCLKD